MNISIDGIQKKEIAKGTTKTKNKNSLFQRSLCCRYFFTLSMLIIYHLFRTNWIPTRIHCSVVEIGNSNRFFFFFQFHTLSIRKQAGCKFSFFLQLQEDLFYFVSLQCISFGVFKLLFNPVLKMKKKPIFQFHTVTHSCV